MSYTIRLLNVDGKDQTKVLSEIILEKVREDGRFRISDIRCGEEAKHNTIWLSKIRLNAKKPYCGNHPGPCDALNAGRKMNATYLEWDDWVAFHGLVNGVLDTMKVSADVWTLPQDVSGKFYVRRGTWARVRFDYDTEYSMGRPVRVWNTGTPDQFAEGMSA
jgi:hypothetical protein